MKDIDKELDSVSRIVLIILIVVVSYFLLFLIMNSLLTQGQTQMMRMMNAMHGGMMSFSTTYSAITNLISLIFALGIGFVVSLYLFRKEEKKEKTIDREYRILRKALSEDEKRILDEIKKADEITQDSLRFRLGWSKAKISTILVNLDKRGIIQRERVGKTYRVFLQRNQQKKMV